MRWLFRGPPGCGLLLHNGGADLVRKGLGLNPQVGAGGWGDAVDIVAVVDHGAVLVVQGPDIGGRPLWELLLMLYTLISSRSVEAIVHLIYYPFIAPAVKPLIKLLEATGSIRRMGAILSTSQGGGPKGNHQVVAKADKDTGGKHRRKIFRQKSARKKPAPRQISWVEWGGMTSIKRKGRMDTAVKATRNSSFSVFAV